MNYKLITKHGNKIKLKTVLMSLHKDAIKWNYVLCFKRKFVIN